MKYYIISMMIILLSVSLVSGAVPERQPPAAALGGLTLEMPAIKAGSTLDEVDGSYRDYGLVGACNRIVDTMCIAECGGMGIPWPAPPCEDPSLVHGNVFAPAGMAMLYAYPVTGLPKHLLAGLDFAEFGICYSYPGGEYKFASNTPYFLYYLTEIIPSARQYKSHAENEFFGALANGTYGESSWYTADFLTHVETTRVGANINLRAYEMATLVKASYLIGNSSQFQDFACWTMTTAIDTLDGSQYYDVLGSAAAVFSLVTMSLDYDPQAGLWAAETSMQGVMNALLNSQDPITGGFVWDANLTPPFNDYDLDVQSTAYAVLAMKALDPWYYSAEIAAAESYLWSTQLPNGGFLSYIGGDENIQIDGEAIWALQYVPDPWNDGDVDGNGQLTPQDSQMAFYIYLGTLRPTWQQNSSADCNGDGSITAGDAQCIFRAHLYGDCNCFNPIMTDPCHKSHAISKPIAADYDGHLVVDIHHDMQVATVTISVEESMQEIDCFSLDLDIPGDWVLLDTRFNKDSKWIMADAIQNDGFVRVGAFAELIQHSEKQHGELVELTFTRNNKALLASSPESVKIRNLTDDIKNFSVDVIR